MTEPACVGALIRDEHHRVFAHRRTLHRRLFPGLWDIVGGHIESGEDPEEALAREVAEETGWRVSRIEAQIADWEWEVDGEVRRELDYLVEIDGDLGRPQLEVGKQDAYTWIGPDDLDLMMEGRTDGDRRLRDLVAKATRIRLTERLRLEPLGPEHVEDLLELHRDPAVAAWSDGEWTEAVARERISRAVAAWEMVRVDKWMAYDRTTGALVGRGGVSRRPIDGRDRHEVGWYLRGDRWGQGYATEIGRAGLAYAFDHLDVEEVVAFTEPEDHRSRAVMRRVGMHDAGEIEHAGRLMVLTSIGRRDRGHAPPRG